MIVIASTNGIIGIRESKRVLEAGGSAVDAVEAGIRLVEANPRDHSVGYGGFANLLGQVELDASLMDGRDLTAGAVGAIQGYKHPISVARKVMEHLPHVMLVGGGAERFAAEMGFERCELLTKEIHKAWGLRLQAELGDAALSRLAERSDLFKLVEIATDPERTTQWFAKAAQEDVDVQKLIEDGKQTWLTKGTVNFIAQDAQGNICAGASTSGWAWKYPGRLGDTPIIGAGMYADNRYGAAACTGMGEMAIRASTARSVAIYMKMGLSLEKAGQQAMEDLDDLGGRYLGRMSFIALDHEGRHAGFSNVEDNTYVYQTDGMDEPQVVTRTCVQAKRRWGGRKEAQ